MTKLTGSLGVKNEINASIIGTGARGKEGKSAYEIWIDLGNEGTEQEYLASLKGDKGNDGKDGNDMFAFKIVDGNLIVVYQDISQSHDFSLNEDGELIYKF